jgi:hypothetical protein
MLLCVQHLARLYPCSVSYVYRCRALRMDGVVALPRYVIQYEFCIRYQTFFFELILMSAPTCTRSATIAVAAVDPPYSHVLVHALPVLATSDISLVHGRSLKGQRGFLSFADSPT